MVTIDPAYVAPGEVWLVDAPGGRAGVWVGMRPGLDTGVWWRLVRVGGDGIVYLRDDDVRLLDQLLPASREAAERDRDLLRRAHSIVERERDEARAERDEAVARAEAAEARTAPAVSRADVAEALSRCINPEMWNVTFPSVVSEVCDLFGVEAGQAADPVEEKARELYRAATPDARWETVADEYRRIAAHVLGQEAGDERS